MAHILAEQHQSGTQVDSNGTPLFVRHYLCDAAADLTDLPKTAAEGIADGSLAFIPSTGATHTLYDEEWPQL